MIEQYMKVIYSSLQSLLPSDWEKLVLQGNILDQSYGFVFFVYSNKMNKYYQNFDLINQGYFTLDEQRTVFHKLAVISRKAKKNKAWLSYTIILEHNGKFSIDYYYSEDEILITEQWKEKYLI